MTSAVVGVVELRAPLSTVTSEHDGRRLRVHQGPTLMHQPQVEQVVAELEQIQEFQEQLILVVVVEDGFLYTSDPADDGLGGGLGGARVLKKH